MRSGNMPLPIGDFGLGISDYGLIRLAGAGGADGGHGHRHKLVGFTEEGGDGVSRRFAGVTEHLQPVHRLVAVLLNNGKLRDEISR
jgi:hypothetical protein